MTIAFRPAKREQVGLIIGLAGPSGSGKTYSAMRLASGITGGQPFALLDTENRRGLHYADFFKFDHADLTPPFSPDRYAEAIKAADAAGYPVVVVDSMSHEWDGIGGCLEMHEAELARMAKDDERRRDQVKMAAWIKPKMAHRQLVNRLLQVRAHLILCLRAEPKIDMVKDAQGKTQIVPKETLSGFKGLIPICEKNLLYEFTASFILTPDRPGVGQPIKLQAQHRDIFPKDAQIDEAAGQRLAAWAAGGEARPQPAPMSESEALATDVAEKFDALTKGQLAEGKELAALAEKWHRDGKITPAHWPIVEAAKTRARGRVA